MKDLFPHHAPRSVAGLTLQAAIDGAQEAAVRQVEAVPPSRTPLAQDRRRKAALEQGIQELESSIRARRQVFKPWNDELEQFEQADKTLLTKYTQRLASVTRRLAAAATALLVAGGLTLAGFLSPQSHTPALSLPKAPHEAEPSTTPPDVTDDGWRGPSFWA